jgi:hypothetical protein
MCWRFRKASSRRRIENSLQFSARLIMVKLAETGKARQWRFRAREQLPKIDQCAQFKYGLETDVNCDASRVHAVGACSLRPSLKIGETRTTFD